MATVPNDVDEIRRQMALIRRELHEDVKEVVATAEAATDWRRYIMGYPWVSLGIAFAIGYVIVPRRHKSSEVLADISKVRRIVEATGEQVAESAKAQVESAKARVEPEKRRKSLIGAGLGMLAPLVLRAAQGYALKYVEQWILNQQSATLHAGPSPAHPGPQGGPGPGRPPLRLPAPGKSGVVLTPGKRPSDVTEARDDRPPAGP